MSEKNEKFLIKYKTRNYDISRFFSNHPGEDKFWQQFYCEIFDIFLSGGSEVLRSFEGKDIEKAFKLVGHSQAAVNLLEIYKIQDEDHNDSLDVWKWS